MTDIVIEDPRWEALDLAGLVRDASTRTLAHLGIEAEDPELSLLACDDARIAVLNADFRGKPVPTNVLSWPAEERGAEMPGGRPDTPQPGHDGSIELGDIALAYETCLKEAQAGRLTFEAHVTHLLVHGVLHLLGYDHEEDADAVLMEGLESEILGKMGIDDPYRSNTAEQDPPE